MGGTGGDELTAAYRDWRLVVRQPTASGEPVVVRVERSQPSLALLLAVLFWLAGALLGVGIVRLLRGVGGWGVLGVALLAPHTALVSIYLVMGMVETRGTGPFPLPWAPIMDGAVRPLTVLGALLAFGGLTGSLVMRRRTGRPEAAVG
ncbi:hypothetical protein [Paractinoplanes lichenicola]|uniref:Uncharacterized protein n=1 Tax=Paractinoplanes lichenicola TaxID=2802976 RepID=A0ABS1W3W1_9ACTN|nr:hypothetical protein [Actinoplanes lichenicola]MBL7261426.1 hypothetical protein [Actinoplanes lichenicola]